MPKIFLNTMQKVPAEKPYRYQEIPKNTKRFRSVMTSITVFTQSQYLSRTDWVGLKVWQILSWS